MSSLTRPRTLLHGTAIASSFLALLIPLLILGGRKQARHDAHTTIALEHALPLTLSITVKHARDGTLFEIGDASGLTYVSIPTVWKRREVWGVPVAAVTEEGGGFGFFRWHLPPKGHMAFFARPSPPTLLLENPATSHLTLKIRILDLDRNHTNTRTILIDKESQKVLW